MIALTPASFEETVDVNSSAPISGVAERVVQSMSVDVKPETAVPSKARLTEAATSRCRFEAETNTGAVLVEEPSRPVSVCQAAKVALFTVPPVLASTYVPGPAPAE